MSRIHDRTSTIYEVPLGQQGVTGREILVNGRRVRNRRILDFTAHKAFSDGFQLMKLELLLSRSMVFDIRVWSAFFLLF